jgi:hypothetical protein
VFVRVDGADGSFAYVHSRAELELGGADRSFHGNFGGQTMGLLWILVLLLILS